MTTSIVLASGNAGKLREFQQLLQPLAQTIVPQSDLNISDADETGLSFVENAIIKARHASSLSGMPALADDSGLCVDALGGAPGIFSARYGEDLYDIHHSDRVQRDTINNRKLLHALLDTPDAARTAHFLCVLVFMRHAEDPAPLICQGRWSGRILHEPAGEGGFGYDPLFFVPEFHCSSAQLSPKQKNRLSHRGKAMQQLLQQLSA